MVHITIGDGTGNGRAQPTLAENWNQTGPVSVVTFTNCDSVDLYVNATKIGTRKSSDFAKTGVMQWTNIPWQSGVIKAIGITGGKEVARDSIRTVGTPVKLMLQPDRTALEADGSDVSSIEVDICDADNNTICTASNLVKFSTSGPARNVGIASGDWTNDEPYKGTAGKHTKGKC
jgi:beta-galactosidase